MSDLSMAPTNDVAHGLTLEVTPHYYVGGVRGPLGAEPGVHLQLVVGEDRFNIEARRGKTAALLESLRNAFGVAPIEGLRTVAAGGFDFVGIGPSRWHAIAREPSRTEQRVQLREAVRDLATIVDVAHGFAVFRLTGPKAREALTRLVRVDLDPEFFSPGACATTELHGMAVQLRRTLDGDAYECAVARSFAGSLFHALTRAAEPLGLRVETPAKVG